MKEILKEKDMKLAACNSCTNNYLNKFQDVIHGKDGDQRELHKLLSEIRREYENVKRTVN